MTTTVPTTMESRTGSPAEKDTAPLLEIADVEVAFPTGRGLLRAVDGVSLVVDRGECLGVVGESGSGKSVLMRSVMQLLPDTTEFGKRSVIRWQGRDIATMRPEDKLHLWGPQLAMIFQDPMTSLNPVRRVGDQIGDPLRFHLGLTRRLARAQALDLLGQVGIADPRRRLDQYPHELSGGMRQRVMIAIALSCEPRLLIADEPTTALDVTVQRQILDLLRRLQRERDMAMVLISHDLGVVAGYTDRVAVMYAGRVVETSSTRTLFRDMRHRYTSALLRSTPRIELAPHTPLDAIAGRPPDMTAPPPGCRFAPRCAHALARCSQETPSLSRDGIDRLVACHNLVPRVDAGTNHSTHTGGL